MAVEKLTAMKVRSLVKPGRYGDGGQLWLQVRDADRRSWIFRYTSPVTGAPRWAGLGPLHDVTLAEARMAAREARRQVRAGIDPVEAREEARRAIVTEERPLTFKEAAERYIAQHQAHWGEKGQKSAGQWRGSLAMHVYPIIGKRRVAAITVHDVLAVLEPIWTTKTETASRIRGRIEAILDAAKVKGWRAGDNPAAWRGNLASLLAAKSKIAKVEHFAAAPWGSIPAIMAKLTASTSGRCLALLIMTATRSAEARGAMWGEIDFDAATWVIPATRMKGNRPHRIPLAPEAVALLRSIKPDHAAKATLVFPGGVPGRPLSDVALSKALRSAAGENVTVHGCRSSFRDYCGEAISVPREVAELSLAHINRDRSEAAYARSDLLDKRRRLMDGWALYCCTGHVARYEAG